MASTEKIGGVELSTYGLQLGRPGLQGDLDLPEFKNVIRWHSLEANLQVLDEKNVSIVLFGKYASRAAMGTAISNFRTKIESATKQTWEFTNYGFNETCVVKHGIKTQVYGMLAIEVQMTLTITV